MEVDGGSYTSPNTFSLKQKKKQKTKNKKQKTKTKNQKKQKNKKQNKKKKTKKQKQKTKQNKTKKDKQDVAKLALEHVSNKIKDWRVLLFMNKMLPNLQWNMYQRR